MKFAQGLRVFAPKTINDALSILRKRPDVLITAGATAIQTESLDGFASTHTGSSSEESRDILALHNIEELQRIYRSDRMLEIGAMVSLERLSRFESEVIPAGMRQLIQSIPHPPVRSLSSLGGNIMANPRYISSYHYLLLSDARVELRKAGSSRWIPVKQLRDEESDAPSRGELITRIRIPIDIWDHQMFRRFHSRTIDADYGFLALATIHRSTIEDIRLAYAFPGLRQVRSRNAESLLIGKRLPVSDREIRQVLAEIADSWEQFGGPEAEDGLLTSRLNNLTVWFVHNLQKS